jgi:hypothetical protein
VRLQQLVSKHCLLPVAVLVSGCGGIQQATRLEDGSWKIQCAQQMEACVRQAARVCGKRDYEILGGGKETKVFGGVTGEQAAAQRHSLVVRCDGQPRSVPKALLDDESANQERPPAAAPSDTPPGESKAQNVPQSRAEQVCAPGATQQCFGPGACRGGQGCKDDGSGYLPCDCGGGSGEPKATDADEGKAPGSD